MAYTEEHFCLNLSEHKMVSRNRMVREMVLFDWKGIQDGLFT
jgi:hypothetical protein